jgi:hypothetical protein
VSGLKWARSSFPGPQKATDRGPGALTNRPAEEIAEEAQQWGQDDEITVVKAMRIAKLEPVPA